MSKDEITVYWAPMAEKIPPAPQFIDDSLMYKAPIPAYNEIKKNINMETAKTKENVLFCPAFKDILHNTFIMSSTAEADYSVPDNGELQPRKEYGLRTTAPRRPSINGRKHFTLDLEWIFFSEEPLEMEVTTPYFTNAPHLKYAEIVPGKYNIGKWYRPINAEFVLREGVNEFVTEADEPLMYVRFNTEKKIKLRRYQMTDELYGLAFACVQHRYTFGESKPLWKHYKTFRSSGIRNKILYNIKKNLVD